MAAFNWVAETAPGVLDGAVVGVGASITGANADNWFVCACDAVAIVTDIPITALHSAILRGVQTDVLTTIPTG